MVCIASLFCVVLWCKLFKCSVSGNKSVLDLKCKSSLKWFSIWKFVSFFKSTNRKLKPQRPILKVWMKRCVLVVAMRILWLYLLLQIISQLTCILAKTESCGWKCKDNGSFLGFLTGTWARIVAKQYWVTNGALTVMHSSKSPIWKVLPRRMPSVDFAVASHTADK